MKKLLVSLFLFAGVSLSTFAQGFEPQVKVGYSYGVDNYKNQTFGGEFLAGFRINPTIRLGVGVGISYCDLKYEDAYYDSNTHSPARNNTRRRMVLSNPYRRDNISPANRRHVYLG